MRDLEARLKQPFQPIFILGDHRSGTTLLYRLLAESGGVNYVSAYHIIEREGLLEQAAAGRQEAARAALADRFRAAGLEDRVIDGVQVSPDLPEEYGFILQGERFRPQLKPGNLAAFDQFCRTVQAVSAAERPLLLKNPWDYLNFAYLARVYPEARYIFLHRNPVHVVNSQLKATRSVFAAPNGYAAMIADWYAETVQSPLRRFGAQLLFGPRLGPRIVTRHVNRAAGYFLAHHAALPPAQVIEVRYEDLCERAGQEVGRLLDFLGIDGGDPATYDAMIQPRPLRLLPEVEAREEAIRSRLRRYIDYCRY